MKLNGFLNTRMNVRNRLMIMDQRAICIIMTCSMWASAWQRKFPAKSTVPGSRTTRGCAHMDIGFPLISFSRSGFDVFPIIAVNLIITLVVTATLLIKGELPTLDIIWVIARSVLFKAHAIERRC